MSTISFRQQGKGSVVLLLHGFPLNHTIWDKLSDKLSGEFTVVTPDLPGFGQSEILPLPFSIDDVAEALLKWMDEHPWKDVVLIGHSLGGYVALAMVEKKPEIFSGLGLFHSAALADNAEKKDSRTKVIKFVEEHGAEAFTSAFVQPLFADAQHPAIEITKAISVDAGAEVVKGYTAAMRDRPDRASVLKNFIKPVLFIAGENDAVIPVESITQQAQLCKDARVQVLKKTGHMGMIESVEESFLTIRSFLQQIYSFKA